MQKLPFEWLLAFRHLRSGGWQTVLTVGAVATAVTVIVFITSLIIGVQQRLFADLIGSLPHVTVKAPEREAHTLAEIGARTPGFRNGGTLLSSQREKRAQQRTDIESWQGVAEQLGSFEGVRAVAPIVRGQAFLIRGQRRFGIAITGADPLQVDKIVHLQRDMVSGNWLALRPEEIVIGYKLAQDAGVAPGDRVRITSANGISSTFTVAGVFETGLDVADRGAGYVTLRAAQALFAQRQSISVFTLNLNDPFNANHTADSISAALPYKTESWMREQAEFMDALKAQNSTTILICAFALLASTMSIASVLVVSVMQKAKQIGILKSMGARDRQILLIFTLEGLGIALVGSWAGALASYGLLRYLMQFKRAVRIGKIDDLFPILLDARIFAVAMGAAILATVAAALLPARRAAHMDPVEIIRGD